MLTGRLYYNLTLSPDAKDYVSRIRKKIVLIDPYVVKKIDSDYFSEE